MAEPQFAFDAEVIPWRGPSPYFFVPLPVEVADEVQRLARAASYGWGMIPVAARIGAADFTTSLFRKDGIYLLPLKDSVRKAAAITAGDAVRVAMRVQLRGPPGAPIS